MLKPGQNPYSWNSTWTYGQGAEKRKCPGKPRRMASLSGGRYSVVGLQDRSPRSGSRLLYRASLWFLILFHPTVGYPIAVSRAFRWSSYGKALAMWPNIYYWFEWVMSLEKNGLELHLFVQIAQCLPLYNSILFRNFFKAPWKYAFEIPQKLFFTFIV